MFFSVADGGAVEQLVRHSNLINAKDNSNLSEPHVENSVSISDLKLAAVTDDNILNPMNGIARNFPNTPIIWSSPKAFIEPVHIAQFHQGINFQCSTNLSLIMIFQ